MLKREEAMMFQGMESAAKPGATDAGKIRAALHDLCQPLTALQCRLEIGQMTGTLQGYEDAVEEGLVECARLVASVTAMRELLARGMERESR